MGFLDDAKEKLTELASQHPDQVESLSDQALERGGAAVASAPGGRYAAPDDPVQARGAEAIGS